MRTAVALLSVFITLAAAPLARAEELLIPQGTVVFGQLDERITSNANKFRIGYPVDGHVWKDVIVDGHTIIRAGTPIELRISRLAGKSVGGQGGALQIMAVSVKSVDGTEISLAGGYDQSAPDISGLTRALSMFIWPASFLPGKNAVLDVGTVFDSSIPANTRIVLPDGELPTLKLVPRADLVVDVLYDDIDQKEGTLPLSLRLCDKEYTREAHITAVNDDEVRPILVSIIIGKRGESCHEFTGRVNLESLKEHFKPGINRFTVSMGGAQATTVLNVEM
ncbi:MAG TPA: hypothetical protein VF405_10230 [Gammaproteobacteria bacterium]